MTRAKRPAATADQLIARRAELIAEIERIDAALLKIGLRPAMRAPKPARPAVASLLGILAAGPVPIATLREHPCMPTKGHAVEQIVHKLVQEGELVRVRRGVVALAPR